MLKSTHTSSTKAFLLLRPDVELLNCSDKLITIVAVLLYENIIFRRQGFQSVLGTYIKTTSKMYILNPLLVLCAVNPHQGVWILSKWANVQKEQTQL